MMERIELKDQGISLSRLIYGAWRLNDDPDTSPGNVLKKIELCLEQGIDTFDHADIYGDYECEQIFGRALAESPEIRKRTVNISKCDIMLLSEKFPERRVKYYDTSAGHIESSVEQSLKNLGVETLDLLLIHRPDPLMDADETGDALDRCIKSGKIRAAGVSNFSPWDFDLLQSRIKNRLAANQVEISVLRREAFLDGTLSHLQTNGALPMAWSPLAGGRLFGSDADAVRVRSVLEAKASQNGVSADTVALAWLLRHPARILPVFGTNRPARIQSAHQAFQVKLSRQDWYEIWTAAAGQEVP